MGKRLWEGEGTGVGSWAVEEREERKGCLSPGISMSKRMRGKQEMAHMFNVTPGP